MELQPWYIIHIFYIHICIYVYTRDYELRECIPVATHAPNCMISIFSAGGYFYVEPKTLQVWMIATNSVGNFLKRKGPNRSRPKPEFRESCSWALFGRGTFDLAWIWFRTDWNLKQHMNTTWRGLNEILLAHAGEFISKCGDPFCKYIQNVQFLNTN